MLKERVKSSIILMLIFNLLFLTFQVWFINSGDVLKDSIIKYVRQIPIVETFFPMEQKYSLSKENLSKPRKFLINDGSLWMAYYNTDLGFSPINERTKELITSLLSGETKGTKKTDTKTWEAGLESLSIYVEYPVSFSSEMFCRIMGVDEANSPKDIKAYREFIIIPSSSESDICILARDSANKESVYAYILSDKYSLPASDLSIYTSNSDGYYQPAFSTGLEIGGESKVSLDPLVLFSDSLPSTKILHPEPLITGKSNKLLLENFGFNSEMNPYLDSDGGTNYIANYATATVFPDGIFEYKSVNDERGILLDESGNSYNVLNASIDFAEQTWSCLSKEPLSILVSSDLSGYNSSDAYTFKFDYYCNGRPVEVNLPDQYGHNGMDCAIEITVKNGRLISYRQYMNSYKSVENYTLSEPFVTALDYFVQMLDESSSHSVVIEDIYIGYLDDGTSTDLHAAWLARTDSGRIYQYKTQ